MKNLLHATRAMKVPFLVMVSLMTLTLLLVACTGLPNVTSPQGEEAAKPSAEEASKPSIEELPVPASAERLPGTADFTDTTPTSKGGAVLGSPAYDMFLKIDGVPGESTDSKHKEWIEVLSFSQGVSQPSSRSLSPGGAMSAEPAAHQYFSIMKVLDKASPKLMQYCSNGKHIKDVVLELCRAEGDGQRFMEYKMTDVIISSVRPSGSAGDAVPTEEVSFNYAKIELTNY